MAIFLISSIFIGMLNLNLQSKPFIGINYDLKTGEYRWLLVRFALNDLIAKEVDFLSLDEFTIAAQGERYYIAAEHCSYVDGEVIVNTKFASLLS